MGGLHGVAVREAEWESVSHGHFVDARRGGDQKMASLPRVNDGSVVVGGDVGGNYNRRIQIVYI